MRCGCLGKYMLNFCRTVTAASARSLGVISRLDEPHFCTQSLSSSARYSKSGQSRTGAYMETTVRSAWSFGVAETPDQQDLSHQALSTRSGCAIHQVVAVLSTFQGCSLPGIHLVHPLGSIRLHSHEKLITKSFCASLVDIRLCFVFCAK